MIYVLGALLLIVLVGFLLAGLSEWFEHREKMLDKRIQEILAETQLEQASADRYRASFGPPVASLPGRRESEAP